MAFFSQAAGNINILAAIVKARIESLYLQKRLFAEGGIASGDEGYPCLCPLDVGIKPDRAASRMSNAGRPSTEAVGPGREKGIDPEFPPKALDIAFMTNTYHHLEKPVELVRSILPALKEGGRLVIVERDYDRSAHKDEATTKEKFNRQMDQAGFKVITVDTSMQEDNIYICLPKEK